MTPITLLHAAKALRGFLFAPESLPTLTAFPCCTSPDQIGLDLAFHCLLTQSLAQTNVILGLNVPIDEYKYTILEKFEFSFQDTAQNI